mgnify:CR=1 FL=1
MADETVTVSDSGITVTVVEDNITVVTVGTQGPPGAPPVPPRAFTAGAASIAAQKLVALISDVLVVADPTNSAHMGHVVGMTRTSVGIGETVTADLEGAVTWDGAALTPGPYFVGLAGALSTTPPIGAVFIQSAGYALTTTLFVLDIDSTIIVV